MISPNGRGRPGQTEQPQNSSAGWLITFCVGNYDDDNNIANGGTDQNGDGAIYIVFRARPQRDCGRHLPDCGDSGDERAH